MFDCVLIHKNSSSLYDLLIDPKTLPNDHAMCIGPKTIFIKYYFGQLAFIQIRLYKTPKIEVCTTSPQIGWNVLHERLYLKPTRYKTSQNHQVLFFKIIFLFYLKAFI